MQTFRTEGESGLREHFAASTNWSQDNIEYCTTVVKDFEAAEDWDTAKDVLLKAGFSAEEADEVLAYTEPEDTEPVDTDPLPLFPTLPKTIPNWVTYAGPNDKALRISGTMHFAKSNDPTTWVDYKTACENIAKGLGCQFLGFVTNGEQSGFLTGIDIDGGKTESGQQEWVERAVAAIEQITGATYREQTPNGGQRIWVQGDFKKHGRRSKYKMAAEAGWKGKTQQVEVFDDGLYFTVTGNRLSETSDIAVLNDEQVLSILDALAKLSIEDPIVNVKKSSGEADPAFEKLIEQVGWKPLEDRLDKMVDTRYHGLRLEKGKTMYCPIPSHGEPNLNAPYSRCFGIVPDTDETVAHCFACDWSGDVIKAVRDFDVDENGKSIYPTMTDAARAICVENGLDPMALFPDTNLKMGAVPDANAAAQAKLLDGEPRAFDPWQYALKPLYGQQFSGWFPLGRVALVSGSSGAMKTTFLSQALVAGRDGEAFLGHEPGRLPFIFLFADRGKYDCEETFERMDLVDKIPFQCINGIPKHEVPQVVANTAASGLYKVLVIDGGDLLVADNNDGGAVGDFTANVQRIAEHYGVAIVITTGAGKMSPQALKQGAERRTITKGSEVWGRTGGSVFTLNSEHDGTQDTRRLIVQHRNAGSERFLLKVHQGRLVAMDEAKVIEESQSNSVLDWVLARERFTAREIRNKFKWNGKTTIDRLTGLLTSDVIKKRKKKEREWFEVPSVIAALEKAAQEGEDAAQQAAANTVDLNAEQPSTDGAVTV